MEITETTIMAAGSDDTLAKLNRAGIQLSIDDFGTGYSSLSYLGRLPVKIIKIDRSFVMRMRNTAGSTAIVRSIIELSHSLDLKVVADGVENADALGLLGQDGCDFVQGLWEGKTQCECTRLSSRRDRDLQGIGLETIGPVKPSERGRGGCRSRLRWGRSRL